MKKADKRIYLSPPHMGGEELHYINEAFAQNWIAPLGENVDNFERDLQHYTGRQHAAVVTSGTAALHLALILCDVQPGDEVICQSMTFAASANPILYQGASPVFVDSELKTWNMDPKLLEEAIWDRIQKKGRKPKAIIIVHLYGMPANMKAIMKVANKYEIPVIEDAAEALGSSINGKKCGTFGLLSVLSFNGNKIITTSGGGALLADKEQLIDQARFLATQARDEAPYYQHSKLGYNYRMSNIVAGIGRGQMNVLPTRVAQRRAIHDNYVDSLQGEWLSAGDTTFDAANLFSGSSSTAKGLYFLKEPKGYYSNRWLTTLLINPDDTGGITNNDVRIALEKKNIESRFLWKPMHLQPLYKDYPYYGSGISDALFHYGLCLPSGSSMQESDFNRVVTAIQKKLSSKKAVRFKKAELNS